MKHLNYIVLTKWIRISNLHLQFIVWHLYLNSHNKWNVGDVWKFMKVGTWILLFVLLRMGITTSLFQPSITGTWIIQCLVNRGTSSVIMMSCVRNVPETSFWKPNNWLPLYHLMRYWVIRYIFLHCFYIDLFALFQRASHLSGEAHEKSLLWKVIFLFKIAIARFSESIVDSWNEIKVNDI